MKRWFRRVLTLTCFVALVPFAGCGNDSDAASGDTSGGRNGGGFIGTGATGASTGGSGGMMSATGGVNSGAGGGPSGMGGSPAGAGGGPAGTGGSTAGTGGSPDGGASRAPSLLPSPPAQCPTIVDGTVKFGSTDVRVWVGTDGMSKKGPLVIYWHGTCSNPLEALLGIGQAQIARIESLGGMVAAIKSPYNSPSGFCGSALPATTTCPGTILGNGVWCREDFDLADQIVACAVQQVGIDTRQIHTIGMSAGGVQSAAHAYERSNYIASVVTYSGGAPLAVIKSPVQDPNNTFAAMIVYGGPSDVVGAANFETITGIYVNELSARGHFSFVCNHGQGHTIPAGIGVSAVQFFLDHPYGGSPPDPYAKALPAGFPAYCALP